MENIKISPNKGFWVSHANALFRCVSGDFIINQEFNIIFEKARFHYINLMLDGKGKHTEVSRSHFFLYEGDSAENYQEYIHEYKEGSFSIYRQDYN